MGICITAKISNEFKVLVDKLNHHLTTGADGYLYHGEDPSAPSGAQSIDLRTLSSEGGWVTLLQHFTSTYHVTTGCSVHRLTNPFLRRRVGPIYKYIYIYIERGIIAIAKTGFFMM
jgi:hypothetical protein